MTLHLFRTRLVNNRCYSLTVNSSTHVVNLYLVNTFWWINIIVCQLCDYFLNDCVSLHITRRTDIWHLEYRLYNIFLVVAIASIDLSIFDARLQYHLHYIMLALNAFLIMFVDIYSTLITINYVTECFSELSLEVSVIMSVYRQILELSLSFFVIQNESWIWLMSLYRLLLLSSHIVSKFELSFTIRLDNWNRLFDIMIFICTCNYFIINTQSLLIID